MTRGRKPAPEPSVPLDLRLPESVRTRLDIHLYSQLEQRVPKGAYQRFFIERINEFLEWGSLDLAPYTGQVAGTQIVRARKSTIEELRKLLER